MFQRRSHRTLPRTRSLAVGGALAALAVVGGGTVVAVNAPSEIAAGDIRLVQNATAQEMELGVPVGLDLEPVVARAAGGTIPAGTTVQVTGLPDGLTQNGWVISGTPTRAGDYDVLITVSNSGISKSQKVALTVTDAPGAAAATTTTAPTTAAAPSTATGGAGEGTTTTSPATSTQTAPTLAAAPGDPTAGGDTDALTDALTDDALTDDALTGEGADAGTTPDLCAIVGDGELDSSSLASGLVPLLVGDDESAPSGLILMLVNAIVGMLPSVLGESGSAGDLGSAGKALCTLSPALLGGDATAATTAATTTATTPAGDGTGGATALGGTPAALLGLLTGGAGSLGG